MSQENSTRFTIGQFAALHEINKKTLMWYDEIGLFQPDVIGENGYRYYTYQQSSTLETILMLRELHVSIPVIRSFIQDRSVQSLDQLFKEKVADIDQTILHLQEIRGALVRQRAELHHLQQIDLDGIQLVKKEAQPLAVIKTAKDISLEKGMELILEEAKRQQVSRMYGRSYGAMIAVSCLYEKKFEDYSAAFLYAPDMPIANGVHIQPAGMYLRAYCKGNWDKIPQRYVEILEYASEHHLTLHGYSYETGINEAVVDSIDSYITQIDIPVSPSESSYAIDTCM